MIVGSIPYGGNNLKSEIIDNDIESRQSALSVSKFRRNMRDKVF